MSTKQSDKSHKGPKTRASMGSTIRASLLKPVYDELLDMKRFRSLPKKAGITFAPTQSNVQLFASHKQTMGSCTNHLSLDWPLFRKHVAVGSSHTGFIVDIEQEEGLAESIKFVTDQPTRFLSSDEEIVEEDIQEEGSLSSLLEDEEEEARSSDQLQGGLHSEPRMHRQSTVFRRLWLPNDDLCLRPFLSFIRKECVEAFTVTATMLKLEPSSLSGGRNVYPNQVGIQCTFCKHRPINDRREGAVCFPNSLSTIYHSIDTWHRRHLSRCQDIPPPIPVQLGELRAQSQSGIGGNRRYWEYSAKAIGLANQSSGGICFFHDVEDSTDPLREHAAVKEDISFSVSVASSQPIVHLDDAADMTSPFLYQLLSQMEICHYSEDCMVQAKGFKRDIEVGSPGFQCKYCHGKSGFGRYFPASVDTLVLANSDRNIYKHITRCHSCPQSVKSSVQTFFDEQKVNGSSSRQPKGRRKRFFQRVWDRMHAFNVTPPPSMQNDGVA